MPILGLLTQSFLRTTEKNKENNILRLLLFRFSSAVLRKVFVIKNELFASGILKINFQLFGKSPA